MSERLAPLDYYKWHWKRFRLSRNVQRLHYIARGFYRELLDEQFAEGFIPDDMNQLAEICGCPLAVMQEHWIALEKFFPLAAEGQRVNPNQEEHRTELDQKRALAARSGRLSAELRAIRKSTTVEQSATTVEVIPTNVDKSTTTVNDRATPLVAKSTNGQLEEKRREEIERREEQVPRARTESNPPSPLEAVPWNDSELIVEIALASPAGLANAWTENSVHGKTLILSPILDAVLLEAKEQSISEREAALWLLKRVRSITGSVQAEPGWKRFWTAKRMHGFYANTEYRNDQFTQQHNPNGGTTNGHKPDRAQEILDSTRRVREQFPDGLPALLDRDGRIGKPSEASDRPGAAVPRPALDAHARLDW